MQKKKRVDGISLAIVILNILIVIVLIVLVLLIYLYMTGKLEQPDVANMGQEKSAVEMMTTTHLTTAIPEEITISETEDTTIDTTDVGSDETTTDEAAETTTQTEAIEAVAPDSYDEEFFANDLFIGDSIYTGLVNYGFLPSGNVFAQIGLNPESARTKAYDGYTAVTKAEEMQPKRIFIMLGSNGLAYMGNNHMTEQMRLLIEELREVCPDSYIYVVSIPPVTKAHDAEGQETMVMVNGYNKLLKTMTEDIGVVFLDLCSQLQDSTGYFSADYAEADGMHFLGVTYKRMLSFFQRNIEL